MGCVNGRGDVGAPIDTDTDTDTAPPIDSNKKLGGALTVPFGIPFPRGRSSGRVEMEMEMEM